MSELPQPESKKHKHFHIGAFLLLILFIFILFKVNLDTVFNSPQFQKNVNYIENKITLAWNNLFKVNIKIPTIDQSTFDKAVNPDNIKKYFGNTSQETIDQMSSPIGN